MRLHSHGGRTETASDSAVKVDSNPCQYCAWHSGGTFYPLSYRRPQFVGVGQQKPCSEWPFFSLFFVVAVIVYSFSFSFCVCCFLLLFWGVVVCFFNLFCCCCFLLFGFCILFCFSAVAGKHRFKVGNSVENGVFPCCW